MGTEWWYTIISQNLHGIMNKSKSAWNYAFVSDEQIACACMHESMIYVFTQTPDGQTRLYRIPFVKDAIHQLKE